MKKLLLFAAFIIFAAACSDNGKDKPVVEEYEIDLKPNINDPWEWRYITLADGETVSETDAWDIAVLRYKLAEMAIRTPFDSEERTISYMAMGPGGPAIGEKNIVWSGVEAVDFAFETMPPVYTVLPAHTFLSAGEDREYRVKFTGYDAQSGILIMEVEEI